MEIELGYKGEGASLAVVFSQLLYDPKSVEIKAIRRRTGRTISDLLRVWED